MKLLKSVQLATAMNIAHGQALISPGAIALASRCDLTGTKPNAYLGGCVSDDYCNGLDGHRIFNHFHITSDSVKGFGQTLQLVPECRQIGADITAGFTCGTDPSLVNGTEVVIPNVPETGINFDSRTIKLLKRSKYESLSTALKTHCEDKTQTCDSINHFSDGCSSAFQSMNGFTRFVNFFAVEDCEAEVTEHHKDNGWVEEYKIYIGYDDLTFQLPNGNEAILNVHKVYEISCKVEKMDEVKTDVEVGIITDNIDIQADLKTNFFIEKFFGDVTDARERKLIEDVIPMEPNSDPNKKIQFKIWSDHPEEYVHLEECELTQEDENGDVIFREVFMRDGCVDPTGTLAQIFDNSPTRNSPTINEDWFNMRPLVMGCKTKWNIKCKTASCKRGLEFENKEAFNEFCSISDSCTSRNYLSSFLNPPTSNVHTRRRRRDAGESSVAEHYVASELKHPCFYVDTVTTTFCSNDICWTLADCATIFPADYPNYIPSESDNQSEFDSDRDSDEEEKLDEIIETMRGLLEEHIEKIKESDEDAEEVLINKISDMAKNILAATHSIEEVTDQIIQSIEKRDS